MTILYFHSSLLIRLNLLEGGVPQHNNAKTHFHGIPHGMVSMKGETTDFLCKGFFRKMGVKTTDSFIANDFSVLFRRAEGSEASMTSALTLMQTMQVHRWLQGVAYGQSSVELYTHVGAVYISFVGCGK